MFVEERTYHRGEVMGENVVNTTMRGTTLVIFIGECIFAEVSDGREDEDFIEDVLYGLGYEWLEDGTLYEYPIEDN